MTDTAPLTMADLPGSGLYRRSGGVFRLTDDRINRLAEAMRAGSFITEAAEFAGIDRSTFYVYRDRGREAIDRLAEAGFVVEREKAAPERGGELYHVMYGEGEPPDISDDDMLCVKMVIEVTHAEREAEMRMVTQWSLAARDDWRAASSFLSKRYSDRWGDKIKAEVSGIDGGPIEVETRADLARTIANDPAARKLASDLLAMVVPSAVEGMDMSLDGDEEAIEVDDEQLPDVGAVEEGEVTEFYLGEDDQPDDFGSEVVEEEEPEEGT